MSAAGTVAWFALAAVAMTFAAPLDAADVKLANGWLRPAHAGQAAALVYIDIDAREPLRLVDARSPVAKRAQLVLVDPPGPDAEHKVVEGLAVAAGTQTRLAYLGSHIRLVEIDRNLDPGARIPLELTFADAKGKRTSLSISAVVRGVVARRPEAPEPIPAK